MMLATKRRATGAATIGLSAVAVLMFILFDTSVLGLDAFYALRLAWIVGPSLALGYGVGLAGILAVVPMRLGLVRVGRVDGGRGARILIFAAMFPITAKNDDRTADRLRGDLRSDPGDLQNERELHVHGGRYPRAAAADPR